MEHKPGFERRRFKRINKRYVISFIQEPFPNIKYNISQIKDISEGGILFSTDKAFQKGDVLDVKIRLPEVGDYVIFKVQVIDSKEVARNLLYDTRASFIAIDEETRQVLRRIVE